MPTIRVKDAIEKLAGAIEKSPHDLLPYFYTELFPQLEAPDVSGEKAKAIADEMIRYLHGEIEPIEVVELWDVVFPEDRHVYYDDDEDLIRYNEGEPWYLML